MHSGKGAIYASTTPLCHHLSQGRRLLEEAFKQFKNKTTCSIRKTNATKSQDCKHYVFFTVHPGFHCKQFVWHACSN